VIEVPAGSFVYGPRDVPHTFTVTSAENARFLLVTEPAGFERFVRALAEPARTLTVPPPPSEPPDFGRLAAVAAGARGRDPGAARNPLMSARPSVAEVP
jgi:hypothetical protein